MMLAYQSKQIRRGEYVNDATYDIHYADITALKEAGKQGGNTQKDRTVHKASTSNRTLSHATLAFTWLHACV